MKRKEPRMFRGVFTFVLVLAIVSMFSACSDDKVAGGSSDDAGIIADLNVAGVAQKGPFAKGSEVTVRGIDCKTMEFTDEIFEGSVKNNMGEFVVNNVNLSTTCAVVEVTGEYRSEMTGKKVSDKLTLRALTNLKDRTYVNVNLLTNLEYERVMYYVAEKGEAFDKAKELAENDVLAAFGMVGESTEFESLDIFGTSDADATLLAISVLMQGNVDVKTLAERLDKFSDSFAKSGEWDDSDTKTAIADWIADAVATDVMDSIRKNMENWGFANEIPDFEKVVEKFVGDSSTNDSNVMTDARDGQTYKTIKIGNQVWMAENLNFETDSSYCYNDSAEYCTKYGRLYSWAAANKACPEGWHLPTIDEFETLFTTVGGQSTAGKKLKSASGWIKDGNGTDDYSFTALPAGGRSTNESFYGGDGGAYFWSSTEYGKNRSYYIFLKYQNDEANEVDYYRDDGMSVRCVKGYVVTKEWSWDVPLAARFNPNIKYDSMVDPRDKRVYRVVKIEVKERDYSQVWMAENLNYDDSVKTPSLKGKSWCYRDSAKYCEVSGRYYTWAAAIDSVALASDTVAPLDCGYGKTCEIGEQRIQGICPDGWHLPNRDEWGWLSVYLGNAGVSGDSLKALTGWDYAGTENNNGVDAYGFTALPTGRRVSDTSWSNIGSDVYYWSSQEYSANEAQYSNMNNIYTKFYLYQGAKYYGQSVRCVKD